MCSLEIKVYNISQISYRKSQQRESSTGAGTLCGRLGQALRSDEAVKNLVSLESESF